jgi:putative Mg2+ transporter-C (MgtC) family protein
MIEYSEITFRLLAAVLIGCVIGLDRNLHGKPTGFKTLGLVGLGASLVTMASMHFSLTPGTYDPSAVGRAIQGLITGVGFLGAGVIIHDPTKERVHGLTTAASIWVTAALGMVCGMGLWQIAGVAVTIVLFLFIIGRPIEKMIYIRWLNKSAEERAAISKHEE